MIGSASGPFLHSRPIKAKFILPALTEATSPYWRPIKYSLFPPLGLATLAAYLSPDDHAVIVDEHVEQLGLGDEPDLVVIQVYITNAYRAYKIADHYRGKNAFVCLGGLHVTALPDEAAVHADAIFLTHRQQAAHWIVFHPFVVTLYAETITSSLTLSSLRADARNIATSVTRMHSFKGATDSTRSASTMPSPRLTDCRDATSISLTITCSATVVSPKSYSRA